MGDKQISLEDVYNMLIDIKEDLSKSIEGLKENVTTLSNQIDKQYSEIKEEINTVKEENKVLKEKIKQTERKLKNKNLIFYGIKEDLEETDRLLASKIINIIKTKLSLNISNYEITNAYRIGKKSNRDRPVLIEFLTNFARKEIISKRTQLKGTDIFIKEDLTEEDRQERKKLQEVAKQLKQINKNCFVKGNSLVVEGVVYSHTDVISGKLPNLVDPHYNPNTPKSVDLEASEVNSENKEPKKIQQREKESDKKRKLIETPEESTGTKPKRANDMQNQRPTTRNRILTSIS